MSQAKKNKKRKKKANSEITHASQQDTPLQPEEISEKIIQIVGHEFSGPLPPPGVLKAYDEIVPGAAERIITMAESQAKHRREMEKQLLQSDITLAKRGQWIAGILSFLIIFLIGFSIFKGDQVTAGILSGTTLLGVASLFIKRKFFQPESKDNN